MITPNKKILVIKELPHRKVPYWVRLAVKVFPAIVRCQLTRKRQHINNHVLPALLKKVYKCQNRSELETLLGKPKSIIVGEGHFEEFSQTKERFIPDTVEIYIKKRCRIDLWFGDNQLHSIKGCEELWPWDFIELSSINKLRAKRQKNTERLFEVINDEKEQDFLNQDITLQTFTIFLKKYFPFHKFDHDKHLISMVINSIKESGGCSKIAEIIIVLRKAKKAWKAFSKDVDLSNSLAEIAVLFAFVKPKMRQEFYGGIYDSHIAKLIEKYEYLVLFEK